MMMIHDELARACSSTRGAKSLRTATYRRRTTAPVARPVRTAPHQSSWRARCDAAERRARDRPSIQPARSAPVSQLCHLRPRAGP